MLLNVLRNMIQSSNRYYVLVCRNVLTHGVRNKSNRTLRNLNDEINNALAKFVILHVRSLETVNRIFLISFFQYVLDVVDNRFESSTIDGFDLIITRFRRRICVDF
jgi:hypothetical protein